MNFNTIMLSKTKPCQLLGYWVGRVQCCLTSGSVAGSIGSHWLHGDFWVLDQWHGSPRVGGSLMGRKGGTGVIMDILVNYIIGGGFTDLAFQLFDLHLRQKFSFENFINKVLYYTTCSADFAALSFILHVIYICNQCCYCLCCLFCMTVI